jgi:hypothetical protein
MTISIQCDGCGQRSQVVAELAGRRIKCAACGKSLQVPPSAEETPEKGSTDLPEEPSEAGVEYSESGQPIYRHAPRQKEFEFAEGNEDTIQAITEHVQAHVGEVASVFHEIISDLVHIDVFYVEPTDAKPYHTLITSGMSDLPMTVPDGAEEFQHAELLLGLPPSWPLTREAFQDERNYWPVRWLKMLARLPHEYDTWLGYGHTIPNGDPPKPFAPSTKLCCQLLLLPVLTPAEFLTLETAERIIHFYAVVPLYLEEMNFKLRHGTEALEELLRKQEVTELLDVRRPNVCKGRR